jgi:hypothetical protein
MVGKQSQACANAEWSKHLMRDARQPWSLIVSSVFKIALRDLPDGFMIQLFECA